MLKLQPNPTFILPVNVPVAGESQPTKIKLTVRYHKPDELKALLDSNSKMTIDEFVQANVIGWDGVEGTFSEDGLRELLRSYHGLSLVIHKAYFDEVYKAAQGN
ncbi:phage tail assembly chaperone [Herbaspirillum huttiense]|uniref:phage tail assembly chaperone n=1 Tax=Herbaspirillum huttiense TaxID=863372 RepID=UPI0037F9C68B